MWYKVQIFLIQLKPFKLISWSTENWTDAQGICVCPSRVWKMVIFDSFLTFYRQTIQQTNDWQINR